MGVRELTLGGAIIVLLFSVGHCHRQIVSDWEARANAAEGFARSQAEVAEVFAEKATASRYLADSLRGEIDVREQELRQRVEQVRGEAVPDTCVPYVEPRDSIIDSYMGLDLEWAAALEAERASSESWRLAYEAEAEAADSLLAVLEDRPGEAWWIPEFGVGAFAGVDMTGRPVVGAGLTLSWRLP